MKNTGILIDVVNIVLIDTWWNVNVKEVSQIITNDNVLIDTWWNVNLIRLAISELELKVLIDTWWNVNTESLCAWFNIKSF